MSQYKGKKSLNEKGKIGKMTNRKRKSGWKYSVYPQKQRPASHVLYEVEMLMLIQILVIKFPYMRSTNPQYRFSCSCTS